MTKRFYFGNSAAEYTPATIRGDWGFESSDIHMELGVKAGSAATQSAGIPGNEGGNALIGRWISEPLGGPVTFTSGDTISFYVGMKVDNTNNTSGTGTLYIYVTTGDSDTPRGTILSQTGFDSLNTTAQGRGSSGTNLTGSVSAQTGDRIVVEIGWFKGGSAVSGRTGTMDYGNTGSTDLTSGSTNVTTEPGWIQFPETFASQSASPSASPSVSPSKSPSASPSISISASPSKSASASPSISPSKSASASPSISISASPSKSTSASPSISTSASPSASPSAGYADYTKGNYVTLPAGTADLETAYTGGEITDVSTQNGVYVGQGATSEYMIHQFKNFVGSNTVVNITCVARSSLAPSTSSVILEVYNWVAETWTTKDTEAAAGAYEVFTLNAALSGAGLAPYVSGGVVTSRVYQLDV